MSTLDINAQYHNLTALIVCLALLILIRNTKNKHLRIVMAINILACAIAILITTITIIKINKAIPYATTPYNERPIINTPEQPKSIPAILIQTLITSLSPIIIEASIATLPYIIYMRLVTMNRPLIQNDSYKNLLLLNALTFITLGTTVSTHNLILCFVLITLTILVTYKTTNEILKTEAQKQTCILMIPPIITVLATAIVILTSI